VFQFGADSASDSAAGVRVKDAGGQRPAAALRCVTQTTRKKGFYSEVTHRLSGAARVCGFRAHYWWSTGPPARISSGKAGREYPHDIFPVRKSAENIGCSY